MRSKCVERPRARCPHRNTPTCASHHRQRRRECNQARDHQAEQSDPDDHDPVLRARRVRTAPTARMPGGQAPTNKASPSFPIAHRPSANPSDKNAAIQNSSRARRRVAAGSVSMMSCMASGSFAPTDPTDARPDPRTDHLAVGPRRNKAATAPRAAGKAMFWRCGASGGPGPAVPHELRTRVASDLPRSPRPPTAKWSVHRP